jgi:hypothetical protein
VVNGFLSLNLTLNLNSRLSFIPPNPPSFASLKLRESEGGLLVCPELLFLRLIFGILFLNLNFNLNLKLNLNLYLSLPLYLPPLADTIIRINIL